MKLHHIGYAVRDIEKAIREFTALGFRNENDTTHDTRRSVSIQFMRSGDYLVELIAPLGDASPIRSTLKKVGCSPYHLCYEVEDLDGQSRRLIDTGYLLIEEPEGAMALDRRRVTFLYHGEVGLVELVEQEGRD